MWMMIFFGVEGGAQGAGNDGTDLGSVAASRCARVCASLGEKGGKSQRKQVQEFTFVSSNQEQYVFTRKGTEKSDQSFDERS